MILKNKYIYKFKKVNRFNNNNNKKKSQLVKIGHLYIKSSLKNTIISLTNQSGNVFKQWSTKSLKKTKLKKNTPYNIQLIMYKINQYIKFKKLNKLNIFINGKGLKRQVLKNLKKKNIKFGYISDKTAYPFNGCRKKKMKRR